MEGCPDDSKAGDLSLLASERLPALLAVEEQEVGRPRLPMELRRLIVQMVERNAAWGEERIAAEQVVPSKYFVLTENTAVMSSC